MTGQIIQILEVHRGMRLGQWTRGQSASPAEQGAASGRGPWLDGSKSLLATVGSLPDNCFMANVVGRKMKNKTKFCHILKVFLEERIVQCGTESPELNQK